jgi:hypothetical protein
MLRSQQILIALGLVVTAWLLHVSLCDWIIKDEVRGGPAARTPIWLWMDHAGTPVPPTRGGAGSTPPRYTGLFTQPYVAHLTAFILGVVVPILLCTVLGYLLLEWKRKSMILRGLCVTCGYDLRENPATPIGSSARCPECGTEVPARPRLSSNEPRMIGRSGNDSKSESSP